MSVHQRHCRKSNSQAEIDTTIVDPCNKSSQPSNGQAKHHSTDTEAGKLFRHKHLQTDERTADIKDVKLKLKLPPANDEVTWKDIDDEISSAFDTFKDISDAGEQLERREAFIYKYLEERFGTVTPQSSKKMQEHKERNMEKLRKKKNALKKQLKHAIKSQADEEDIFQIRQNFCKIMRLHNKMRKLQQKKNKKKEQEKANRNFKKNPYGYSKRLLEPSNEKHLSFSKDETEKYFSEIYKDTGRDRDFKPSENMNRPPRPSTVVSSTPPTWREIQAILKKARNKSSPGPNGVPYLVYKKCPRTFGHVFKLLVKIWKSGKIPPQWRTGRVILIPKSDNPSSPSGCRPIVLSNASGKIFFQIIARRLLKFLISSGYIDRSVQKGFLPRVSGCVEHTQALMETLQDARRRKKEVTICWLDLANAYGSVSHNLIQFAAEWFHVPEAVRAIIHSYYDDLAVKIATEDWTTDKVSYEQGLFQGCPLSVVLFLMVFQLCLDQLSTHSSRGYSVGAGPLHNQRAYADDLTLIAKSKGAAEMMLRTVERFLQWSATMKAKPAKCRSLSLVKLPGTSSMTPSDPELFIHGVSIPFIHQEPMKFLGQLIFKDLSDTAVRKDTTAKLQSMLRIVDADLVQKTGKLWIYQHMIVPKLSWEFTIYCFPITFAKNLQSIANSFLKKWAGLTRSTTNSVLFRSHYRGGLQLTSLTSKLKCMQLVKFHQLKYAVDESTKFIYGHIANRLRAKKHWNGVRELEERERHLALNELCRGNLGRAGLGLFPLRRVSNMSPKEHRQELSRLAKQSDEEEALVYVYSMAKQGRPLAWDAVMFLDVRWRKLIYSFSDKLLSFYLNSLSDTLPSPANLLLWKMTSLGSCSLCNYNNCTLFHIVSHCRHSLMTGRYNWRHDMVLRKIIEVVLPMLTKKSAPKKGTSFKSNKGTKYFVPPLRQSSSREKAPADDWKIMWDEEFEPYVFPPQIATTNARPDLVIWSQSTKSCVVAELTVCWEENFQQAHERKEGKRDYVDLISRGRQNGWNISYFPVEVGARGVLSDSLSLFLRFMGLPRRKATQTADLVGRTSLQATYTLWLSRDQQKFRRWTLVEKPQPTVGTAAVRQRCPTPPRKFPQQKRSGEHEPTAPAAEYPPSTNTQVTPTGPAASGRRDVETGQPHGLVNLGNTCFLNAIAQCLLVADSLVSFAPPAIVNALTQLKSTPGQTIRPTELVSAISLISPALASGQQQDAAEALEAMLSAESIPSAQLTGEIADVISCVACGTKSVTSRPLVPPILQVPVTAPLLETCVTDLLTPQPLDGRRCTQCLAVASELSTQLITTPQALVVQLLRFQQGAQVHKNTANVTLTPTIHLDGVTWHLTGIVNHVGTLHQGHYTACIRHIHRWFRCYDSRVTGHSRGSF